MKCKNCPAAELDPQYGEFGAIDYYDYICFIDIDEQGYSRGELPNDDFADGTCGCHKHKSTIEKLLKSSLDKQ